MLNLIPNILARYSLFFAGQDVFQGFLVSKLVRNSGLERTWLD